MNGNRPRGLFFVGSDTNVGKTRVAATVARTLVRAGVRVGVYKPAASGCRMVDGQLVSDDAVELWTAAGRPRTLDDVCPQRFLAPLAPHLAAAAEGKRVDARRLREGANVWNERCDVLLVEGAGGLLSPISDDDLVADVAKDLGYPLVVVVADQLGAVHQTLATVHAARTWRGGQTVAGVVLNRPRGTTVADDPSLASNAAEIRRRCESPLLATLDFGAKEFTEQVDWARLAQSPVPQFPNPQSPESAREDARGY